MRGDAARLPFAAGRFETVMTIWLLEHVPDPAAVLGEALRVLTSEGLLICTEDDFARVRPDPGIQFKYHAVRLTCRAPIQLESR